MGDILVNGKKVFREGQTGTTDIGQDITLDVRTHKKGDAAAYTLEREVGNKSSIIGCGKTHEISGENISISHGERE